MLPYSKEEIQEELRFWRQIQETTDRDDADENVKLWEARLKTIMKQEEAGNG